MPFKSMAQRGFMYANHPGIAKRFEKETPKGEHLPKHVAGGIGHRTGGRLASMYAKLKGKS